MCPTFSAVPVTSKCTLVPCFPVGYCRSIDLLTIGIITKLWLCRLCVSPVSITVSIMSILYCIVCYIVVHF